jgi:hypothetical protein
MAVLKNNENKLVFWGAKNSFVTGLDPLGLQNTPISTYALLMPGITNLTNRIRYYGFYCWLLDYYARHIRHTDPNEQYNFIRKAELMLAVLMKAKNPEYPQVTGSRFAIEMIQRLENDFYDIEKNAVKQGDNPTYWKGASGAFGQYYVGAMNDMALIMLSDNHNYICTTESHHKKINGTMLARAFEANTSEEARDLFIKNLLEGKLPVSDIDFLYQQFALHSIAVGQEEWSLYCQMLLQADHPIQEEFVDGSRTSFRRDTIRNILKVIKENDPFPGWGFYTRMIYKNQGALAGESSELLALWYFYHFNELFHFAADSIFWGMMYKLDSRYNQVHLPRFIQEFRDDILNHFAESNNIAANPDLSAAIATVQIDEGTIHRDIEGAIKNKDYKAAAGLGLSLLFSVYKNNHENAEDLQQKAFYYGVLRDGNAIELCEQINSWQGNLSDFLYDYLLRNIIYRHQYVAFRKMGNGTQSTLKFLLEENYIRHIETFEPRFTSPRLFALLNMLTDLSLITPDYKMTDLGEEFLTERF